MITKETLKGLDWYVGRDKTAIEDSIKISVLEDIITESAWCGKECFHFEEGQCKVMQEGGCYFRLRELEDLVEEGK